MLVRQVLPTVLALALGIFIGGRFYASDRVELGESFAGEVADSNSSRPGWSRGPSSGLPALDAVTKRLDEAAAARAALAEEVALLRAQVAQLEQRGPATAALDIDQLTEAALNQTLAELETAPPVDPEQRQLQRFLDAGFSPDRAETLKARQDELALQRLFLRDQARREGWMGSDRYREELGQINASVEQLRSELGDEDYDRFLYATGRPNRVMVRTTLTGGPAQEAGLQPGDAILSYDGSRVFDTRSLVNMTQGGSFGAPTAMEVERDGERLVLYIARGPLGVNMRSTTTKPEGG